MRLGRGSTFWVLFAAVFGLAAPAHAGWQLTFHDEFDGPRVDGRKWKRSDLWANGTLAGNGELQCYRRDGVSQADGLLLLTATPKTTPAADCKGAHFDLRYISGMVTTSGCNQWENAPYCTGLQPFAQAYGYFEVRAKLPKGMGLWPAIWLVPIDGSWPPEIDVMEQLGKDPTTIYQTYHYNDAAGAHQQSGQPYSGKDFSASFSTFAIDWRPGLLIWYVDGKETYRFESPLVASKSMYLLLNLAVGGHWPGNPDASTVFPATMAIDYVRIYKRVDDGKPDDTPPVFETSKTK